MVLEVVQKEVPASGVGYIILRDCPEERIGEALGRGMDKLKRSNAARVLATSLPEGEPLLDGPIGGWRLTHVYDLVVLDRDLTAERPRPAKKLALRPVKKAGEEKTFLELSARCMQGVPHAHTYNADELKAPNHRFGLVWEGESAVGFYDLDTEEKETVIAAFGVDPDRRGQGLGAELVVGLMERIVSQKGQSCHARTATTNAPAMATLAKCGFTQSGELTTWFEVV